MGEVFCGNIVVAHSHWGVWFFIIFTKRYRYPRRCCQTPGARAQSRFYTFLRALIPQLVPYGWNRANTFTPLQFLFQFALVEGQTKRFRDCYRDRYACLRRLIISMPWKNASGEKEIPWCKSKYLFPKALFTKNDARLARASLSIRMHYT